MIFKNIELHGVSELIKSPEGEGYLMARLPKALIDPLGEGIKGQNMGGTGVELRFVVNSPEGADITMRMYTPNFAARCLPVIYGNIGAGWQEAVKCISHEKVCFHVAPPANIERLQRIHQEHHLPFDPHVVRIPLPIGKYVIVDVVGDVRPPKAEELPRLRQLSYGSSITHGSISLLPTGSYAARTAAALGADLHLLGFAGSARMEKELADYIAAREDWDYATLEMGINALDMDEAMFEERVRYFVKTIAGSHPDKPVFLIDIFYHWGDAENDPKTAAFREIVKRVAAELNLPNTAHFNGLDLLSIGSAGLTGDFVHPNVTGHEVISSNLVRAIRDSGLLPG